VVPIVVRRTAKPAVVIRVLPIDGAARNVFLGARALLIFSNLLPTMAPDARVVAEALDLTPAESRLVVLLAGGLALDSVASELGISRETARNHLKSAFSKTGTHRQTELISLVRQLGP
ncbi:helix-turn-helix transcriptional regulator, partial [Bradyrhizobium sp.]|uniref:helix-turn-helix transcriptional regulator n=1 Tax=Bradyrhizobium sp. TaxID=376 RepID=UPI00238F37BA